MTNNKYWVRDIENRIKSSSRDWKRNSGCKVYGRNGGEARAPGRMAKKFPHEEIQTPDLKILVVSSRVKC